MRLSGTKTGAVNQYRGLGNQLWDLAGNRPSLDLRFADDKSLVDATTGTNLIDFSRATSGTYVGSDGLIKTATTNLLLWSEEANNPLWNILSSSILVDPNVTTAPDGAQTADKVKEATTTGGHTIEFTGFAFQSGTTYTVSFYAKAVERSRLRVTWPVIFTNRLAFVDISPGGYGVISDGGTVTSVLPAGNDWFRVVCTTTCTTTANARVGITLVDTGTNVIYTGDGTSGIYLWGAQLEQSSTVGEYIPTTSTINSAPRFDHDPTTGESLGLLVEESRTNLVTNSSAIGAATGTPGTLPTGWGSIAGATGLTSQISGIGTEDGIPYVDFRFFGTTGNNFLTIVPVTGAIGYVTNTDYTASIYTKLVDGSAPSGFNASLRIRYNLSPSGSTDIIGNFSILSTGSLISNRFFSTGTTTGTLTGFGLMFLQLNYTPSQVVDFTIRVGYPQLEQGAFATSVIPTEGTTVTRAADVASISGANFSSWYRQDEGTVFTRFNSYLQEDSVLFCWSLYEDGPNYLALRSATGYTPDRITNLSRVSNSNQFSGEINANGYITGPANDARNAFAYMTDDFGVSWNGGTSFSSSSGAIPAAPSKFTLGSLDGSNHLNGTISRLAYWQTRLPNSTLSTITQ